MQKRERAQPGIPTPPGSHVHGLSRLSNPRLESKAWQLSALTAVNRNILEINCILEINVLPH